MKKRIASALIASTVILAVAGCGNNSTANTTTQAAAANNDAAAANNDAAASTDAATNNDAAANNDAGTDSTDSGSTSYSPEETLTILAWEGNSDTARMVDYFCAQKGYSKDQIVYKGLGENGSAARDQYKQYLSGDGDADILFCEDGWVQQYVNDDTLTKPLSEIGLDKADFPDAYAHVLAYGTDTNGVLKGISWQACPGGFVYRSDLAEEYLGVKSPEEMQALVKDWDTFKATAKTVYDASAGKCALQATTGGLWEVFKCNRTQPWVVNGELQIDTAEQFYDLAKEFKDNGWCAGVPQWDPAWYAAMMDGTAMGEFVPSWGLSTNEGSILYNFTGSGNAAEWGDKYAICQGPTGWYWGGTYMAPSVKINTPDLAKEFIEFYCKNADTMKGYAEESGDFMNNKTTMSQVTFSNELLNGQNHYAIIADSLASVNAEGNAITPYDAQIKDAFNSSVDAYIKGEVADKAAAIDKFYNDVAAALGDDVKVPD